MANFWDGALALASSDAATFAVVFFAGFLLAHVIHAVRYAFFTFGSPFDKIKKFFKLLFFLKIQ